MAFTKSRGGDAQSTSRWVETQIESDELPKSWKKFICLRGDVPIRKLVKYQDPAGNKYKNLELAKDAFHQMKAVSVNNDNRKLSLPSNIYDIPRNLRQKSHVSGLNTTSNIAESNHRKSLPTMIKHKSEPISSNKAHITNRVPQLQSCHLCNIAYESESNLEVHMKNRHGVDNSPSISLPHLVMREDYRHSTQPENFSRSHVGNYPDSSRPIVSEFGNFSKKEMRKHLKTKTKHSAMLSTSNDICDTLPSKPSRLSVPNLPPGPSVIRGDILTSRPRSLSKPSIAEGSDPRIPSLFENNQIFYCDECGIEFSSPGRKRDHVEKMHGSPGKIVDSNGIREHRSQRNYTNFEGMEDLDFLDDTGVADQLKPVYETEYIENYCDEEEVDDEVPDESIEPESGQIWEEDNDEEFYEEEHEEEYTDDDSYQGNDLHESEDNDDIEVISSGVKNLAKFQNDVEVIEDKSTRLLKNLIKPKAIVRNHSLDSLKNRYSQITITNNMRNYSDDENTDEDEGIYQVHDHEEITLDDEPEEVTLDEGDEEDEVLMQTEESIEQENMDKIKNYLMMLNNTEFVKDMIENPDKLLGFNQNAWYAKPSMWKPTKQGEVWQATVSQICSYFDLKDFSLEHNWWFKNWDSFDKFSTEVLCYINPEKPESSLFKLKKAKWFQYLNPDIPEELRFPEETLEDEDE